MSFGAAVKYCMQNLFVFEGRARRSEFWWFYLFLSLATSVVAFALFVAIIVLAFPAGEGSEAAAAGIVVLWLVMLLVSIASNVMLLGVWVRRLHDMGQTGHWLWLTLVSLSIVPLIMAVLEGQRYTNRWGPDPKAGTYPTGYPATYAAPPATYAAPPAAPYGAPAVPPPPPVAGQAPADPFATPPQP